MPSLYVIEEERREREYEIEQISKKNNELKEKIIDLIEDGIIEMHDGKRDYAEKLLHQAQDLVNNLKL
jgi:hypothetical protein